MINEQHGFTLTEFLVAIVILMVGLLGMLTAVNVAMDKNLENVYRTEAIMLADSQMMRLRSQSYDSIATFYLSSSVSRNIRGAMKNYSVIRSVSQPTTKSKQILVNVKWRKKNTQYSHSIESMITSKD
jgi:type IV pilus assembly protein PilV